MWLLNTKTFKLEEYYSHVPSYAILSHRWKKDEEVSFGGLEEPHPHSNRSGFKKIRDFCTKARKRRFAYVWADTCCIDKKSSAELSEAINSMYAYYRRAKICYVHLHDVTTMEDFDKSSWFTRGWTLQELLAPSKLHFFNNKWKPMGSKKGLASRIEATTGIPEKALHDLDLTEYCVADKFSWSAKRQTTREEDRTYCLLGLFGINMPLLYGEGTRAFHRLQEEIIRTSTDASIFLWQGTAVESFGMLASDPSCFSAIPEYTTELVKSKKTVLSMNQGWNLNNTGIDMEVDISPCLLTGNLECIYMLQVHDTWGFVAQPDVIFVKRQTPWSRVFTVTRVSVDGINWSSRSQLPMHYPPVSYGTEMIRILRQPLQEIHTLADEHREWTVSLKTSTEMACAAYQHPRSGPCVKLRSWQKICDTDGKSFEASFSFDPRAATGVHGYLILKLVDDVHVAILVGASRDFQPLCIVLPLCKQILDGLECMDILETYEKIAKDERYEVDFFDKVIQMIGRCGWEDWETPLDIGLSLELTSHISHERGGHRYSHGGFRAYMNFDMAEFIRYYVPTANISRSDSTDCIPHDVRKSLLDAQSDVYTRRVARGLFK